MTTLVCVLLLTVILWVSRPGQHILSSLLPPIIAVNCKGETAKPASRYHSTRIKYTIIYSRPTMTVEADIRLMRCRLTADAPPGYGKFWSQKTYHGCCSRPMADAEAAFCWLWSLTTAHAEAGIRRTLKRDYGARWNLTAADAEAWLRRTLKPDNGWRWSLTTAHAETGPRLTLKQAHGCDAEAWPRPHAQAGLRLTLKPAYGWSWSWSLTTAHVEAGIRSTVKPPYGQNAETRKRRLLNSRLILVLISPVQVRTNNCKSVLKIINH